MALEIEGLVGKAHKKVLQPGMDNVLDTISRDRVGQYLYIFLKLVVVGMLQDANLRVGVSRSLRAQTVHTQQ